MKGELVKRKATAPALTTAESDMRCGVLALSNDCLRELIDAARPLPVALRRAYLERVSMELAGQAVVGPGLCHRIARRVAKEVARSPALAVTLAPPVAADRG